MRGRPAKPAERAGALRAPAPSPPPPPLVCPPQSPNNSGIPMATRQFIYHMLGLSKTYPAGKKVLDNVNLSFYPDAKIGVLGVNGSGKSTLMRIMAGLDTEFVGEGFVAEGAKVGYLSSGSQARPNGRRHLISALAPGLFQLAYVRRRIARWTMPL